MLGISRKPNSQNQGAKRELHLQVNLPLAHLQQCIGRRGAFSAPLVFHEAVRSLSVSLIIRWLKESVWASWFSHEVILYPVLGTKILMSCGYLNMAFNQWQLSLLIHIVEILRIESSKLDFKPTFLRLGNWSVPSITNLESLWPPCFVVSHIFSGSRASRRFRTKVDSYGASRNPSEHRLLLWPECHFS